MQLPSDRPWLSVRQVQIARLRICHRAVACSSLGTSPHTYHDHSRPSELEKWRWSSTAACSPHTDGILPCPEWSWKEVTPRPKKETVLEPNLEEFQIQSELLSIVSDLDELLSVGQVGLDPCNRNTGQSKTIRQSLYQPVVVHHVECGAEIEADQYCSLSVVHWLENVVVNVKYCKYVNVNVNVRHLLS